MALVLDLSYTSASLAIAASSTLSQAIPASSSGAVECFWPLDSWEFGVGRCFFHHKLKQVVGGVPLTGAFALLKVLIWSPCKMALGRSKSPPAVRPLGTFHFHSAAIS